METPSRALRVYADDDNNIYHTEIYRNLALSSSQSFPLHSPWLQSPARAGLANLSPLHAQLQVSSSQSSPSIPMPRLVRVVVNRGS